MNTFLIFIPKYRIKGHEQVYSPKNQNRIYILTACFLPKLSNLIQHFRQYYYGQSFLKSHDFVQILKHVKLLAKDFKFIQYRLFSKLNLSKQYLQ